MNEAYARESDSLYLAGRVYETAAFGATLTTPWSWYIKTNMSEGLRVSLYREEDLLTSFRVREKMILGSGMREVTKIVIAAP